MAEAIVPVYLHPPSDLPAYRRYLAKEDAAHAVHSELGLRWYHHAAPARAAARSLTAERDELHIVVALDYGDARWLNGAIRREAILDNDGKNIGSKMFLPFTFPVLAACMDHVRLSPAYGPSCLNLYEEANVDRPRRVGFDLEFELCHELKNGERDHELRAASLWPADYRTVACTAELFLRRILVDRVIPVLNQLAGSRLATRDLYLLDSSSNTKLSFHVATPLVLASATDVTLFSQWMRATFETCDNPLSPLLDCSVYATRGNMRLPLNRKPATPGSLADKPWLRPVSRIGSLEFATTYDEATPDAPHNYTLELLRQHAWSWVSPNSECISDHLDAWASDSGSSPGGPEGHSNPPPLRESGGRPRPPTAPAAVPAVVPGAVLDFISNRLGVPASEVRVDSARALKAPLNPGGFAGHLTCRVPSTEAALSVFVSPRGNVYATPGDDADTATALVQRGISPARAVPFSDWYAVGGALHSINSNPGLFDVWDSFSQLCASKYPGRDKLLKRWGQFNGAHSLGTLVYMAREDNPEATLSILQEHRSELLGQLGFGGVGCSESAPLTPQNLAVGADVAALERRALRTAVGDMASEPVIAAGAATWNGAWRAPAGRRCVHGTKHFAETTFETTLLALRPCPAPRCGGRIGGGFWRDRDTCDTCRKAAPAAPSGDANAQQLFTLYEKCNGCNAHAELMFVTHVTTALEQKGRAPLLPAALDLYAEVLEKHRPEWELTPCPPFNTAYHRFSSVFTVTEHARYTHKDGKRRAIGLTTDGDVLLGCKTSKTPYAWTTVTHWFRGALSVWFCAEHAAVVAQLPETHTTNAGVVTWALPCCSVSKQCGRKKCRTVTDTPWRYLRHLRAHGVTA